MDEQRRSGETMGVLAREFDVRVLNCSPSGCLLETNAPLAVGTIGSVTLRLDGQELADHIRVVRCQRIAGAGSIYHVGAQFLWLGSLTRRTLRGALAATLVQPSVDVARVATVV